MMMTASISVRNKRRLLVDASRYVSHGSLHSSSTPQSLPDHCPPLAAAARRCRHAVSGQTGRLSL